MSFVEHPAVNNTYQPLVEAMYKKAEINIRLFPVNNSPRSVKALNDGFFDADIGKILSSIKYHDNIIYVPTPIATVALYLICREGVICDETILSNETNIIVSRFSKEMLTNITPINADIAQILSQQRINKMLKAGRVDYSLIADDISSGATNFKEGFKVVIISQEHYYHILHKKHQALLPVLDLALKEVLAQKAK